MPKVSYCQTKAIKAKEMNNQLIAEIYRGMIVKGKEARDVRTYAGFSLSSWYAREESPETFKLGELRNIFDALGTSDEVILAIFGRNGKSRQAAT